MEAILGSVIIFGSISSCCLYLCCKKRYELLPPNSVIVTNALREEWGQPTIPTEKKTNET
jgi:hypothetical protein